MSKAIEWVPVSDRMPDPNSVVVATLLGPLDMRTVTVLYFVNNEWRNRSFQPIESVQVVAWQYFPDPYDADKRSSINCIPCSKKAPTPTIKQDAPILDRFGSYPLSNQEVENVDTLVDAFRVVARLINEYCTDKHEAELAMDRLVEAKMHAVLSIALGSNAKESADNSKR